MKGSPATKQNNEGGDTVTYSSANRLSLVQGSGEPENLQLPSPETENINSCLHAFLRETDQEKADLILGDLVCSYAHPVIVRIVRSTLHVSSKHFGQETQDAEDIINDVALQIISRLRNFKLKPGERQFTDLRGYIAVSAYNACHTYLRQKYPQRHRLKSKLRYILTHDDTFALWQSEDRKWMCGLAEWRNSTKTEQIGTLIIKTSSGSKLLRTLDRFPSETGSSRGWRKLLVSIFNTTSLPVDLKELVKAIDDVYCLPGDRYSLWSTTHIQDQLYLVDSGLTSRLDQRLYLERLWQEIRQLPLEQRNALLLNLRDDQGSECTWLLAFLKLATAGDVAAALAVSSEEFAGIRQRLPLNDAAIAERLGITRQQVINLRKAARRRLVRRMTGFNGIKPLLD